MLATMSEPSASASAVANKAADPASAATTDPCSAPLAPCGRGAGGEGCEIANATATPENSDRPFDQLIVDHGQQITRLVHRLLGWSPDIEDVVQDVFVDAFKNLSQFKSQSSVQTWLTRIAINRCRTHQRKQWLRRVFYKAATGGRATPLADNPLRSPLAPRGTAAGGEGATDATSQTIAAETQAQVHAAIAQLNQRDRELIVLRYLEEQSIDTIAQALNIKTNVVNVRLNRARARLEKILRPLLDD
jgi:RNA polymerase sigma-70 factor (ECF subfamily)